MFVDEEMGSFGRLNMAGCMQYSSMPDPFSVTAYAPPAPPPFRQICGFVHVAQFLSDL